jgi:hypothetical protein
MRNWGNHHLLFGRLALLAFPHAFLFDCPGIDVTGTVQATGTRLMLRREGHHNG